VAKIPSMASTSLLSISFVIFFQHTLWKITISRWNNWNNYLKESYCVLKFHLHGTFFK
jgi:hypothetical protein